MQLHAFPVLNRTTERLPLAGPTPAEQSVWRASLELSKPRSWALPMVAFACGVAASGQLTLTYPHLLRSSLGLMLCGPILGGLYSVINAFYDRDIDRLQHPRRVLPSGQLSVNAVVSQIFLMAMTALAFAHLLDQGLGTALAANLGLGDSDESAIFNATFVALGFALAVNAPPFSLRRKTWFSGVFTSTAKVGLPWIIGHLLFTPLTLGSVVLAAGFTFGAIGLAIVRNLASLEEDRRAGVRSLSALLGREVGLLIGAMLIDTALLAALILTAPQGVLTVLPMALVLVTQVALQAFLYQQPERQDRLYLAMAGSFGLAMALAAATTATGAFIL